MNGFKDKGLDPNIIKVSVLLAEKKGSIFLGISFSKTFVFLIKELHVLANEGYRNLP